MSDAVYEAFLRRQVEEGIALARESAVLDLLPLGNPPDRFMARFTCRGLVRHSAGDVVVAEEFAVGIWFPNDYVRRASPHEVLTWLGPRNVWHPNISDTVPCICIGRLVPGTALVDLLYQVWEIITFNKINLADPLNVAAAEWARHNLERLPIDTRPLKPRSLGLRIDEVMTRPGAVSHQRGPDVQGAELGSSTRGC